MSRLYSWTWKLNSCIWSERKKKWLKREPHGLERKDETSQMNCPIVHTRPLECWLRFLLCELSLSSIRKPKSSQVMTVTMNTLSYLRHCSQSCVLFSAKTCPRRERRDEVIKCLFTFAFTETKSVPEMLQLGAHSPAIFMYEMTRQAVMSFGSSFNKW